MNTYCSKDSIFGIILNIQNSVTSLSFVSSSFAHNFILMLT